ncbi:MAG: ROK family protein [Acidobacteria bacterium]|nr:MAG: ROK family protein [Acidobacteriota bacterium]
MVRWLPNLAGGWRGVELASRLADELAAPAYLMNDVRLAALGELRHGFGQQRRGASFVLVTLGTGVGGAVVVEGSLRLGFADAAGELGHLPIDPGGARCGCGQRGCLETVASAPALVGEATRMLLSGQSPGLAEELERRGRGETGADPGAGVDVEAIAAAAAAGDDAMGRCLDRCAEALATGLAQTVLLLMPDAILLGGGVAGIGEPLRARVERQLRARVTMVPVEQIEILLAPLGGRAGVLGGVALAAAGGEVRR